MQAHHNTTAKLITASLLSAILGLQGCGGGGSSESDAPATETTITLQQTTASAAIQPIAAPAQITQIISEAAVQQTTTGNTSITALQQTIAGNTTTPPQQPGNSGNETQVQATPTPVMQSTPTTESTTTEAVASAEIQEIFIGFNPVSAAAYAGKSYTFNVSASSTDTLNYQWRKNAVAIDGAVMSHYTISSLTLQDAGSYDVIVSNSTHSTHSIAANLSVAVDRSAHLSWIVPTKRQDGATLAAKDIAGYRIYHNTDDGHTENSYDVDTLNTEYELVNLASGTHNFAVTAIDTDGLESDLSDVVTKRVL